MPIHMPGAKPLSAAVQPELLLCCAICSGDHVRARYLLEKAGASIEWSSVIEIAKSHKLDLLLYHALQSQGPDLVDTSVMERLRGPFVENAARSRGLTEELLRLIGLLRSKGIPVIPFKGPVLAAEYYGDVSLRRYGDLDLLVRYADISLVTFLMLADGYRIRMDLSHERSFARATGEQVDVHWSVCEDLHMFPLSTEELWERCGTTNLGGQKVPTLCREDTLLMLCFNGVKERWSNLQRIRDVAELIRGDTGVSWSDFLASCRGWGCERLVLVGLNLAREWFGSPVSGSASIAIRSRKVVRITAKITERVLSPTRSSTAFEDCLYYSEMRERLWEKIPYYQVFAYGLLTPTATDTRLMRRTREVLYRLLRWPLIAARHGLRVLRHAKSGIREHGRRL